MQDRTPNRKPTTPPAVTEGETFRDLDWYAEDLGARAFVSCVFIDADLTEVTSRGARFEDCEFRGGQLNASTHDGSSFTGCRFNRTSFFAATLRGCKLVGTTFVDETSQGDSHSPRIIAVIAWW